MIRSGIPNNQAENFSDSESDWDSTVDFPPIPKSDVEPTGLSAGEEEQLPQPRSRQTVNDPGKYEERSKNVQPQMTDRGDEPARTRGKPGVLLATNSSKMLVPDDRMSRGSHRSSPIPPYTSGFQEAIIGEDDKDISATYAVPSKPHKGTAYVPTPAERSFHKPSTDAEPWEDSEAEQRTLQELQTNFPKEKSREMENKAARVQAQARENSMNTQAAPRSVSLLERWTHSQEDKQRQGEVQELGPQRKKGVDGPPENWSPEQNIKETPLSQALTTPHQPLFVSDPRGNRLIYFLNEGHIEYYEVDEEGTDAVMPKVAEKVEAYIQRGWKEVFGILRIITSLVVVLVTEIIHFGTSFILRPILVGVITSFGNQFIKPVLASLFSLVIQPVFIFMRKVMSGIRLVLSPVIDVLGSIISNVSLVIGAFRLVEINYTVRGHRQIRDQDSRRGGEEVV